MFKDIKYVYYVVGLVVAFVILCCVSECSYRMGKTSAPNCIVDIRTPSANVDVRTNPKRVENV